MKKKSRSRFPAPGDRDDLFFHVDSLPPDIRDFIESMESEPSGASRPPPRSVLPWRAPDGDHPPAGDPGAFPVDDSPVDPAVRWRVFELAREIHKFAPWELLDESAAVAIPLSGGGERILSVLGSLGEYHALSFYPDYATYKVFQSIREPHSPFGPEQFYSFWQWQIALLARYELLPGDEAALKASGIKFPRGVFPSLESFTPGFQPWRAGGRETAELAELGEAAVALFSDDEAMDALMLDPPEGDDEIFVWAPDGTGERKLSTTVRSPELRFALDLPNLLLVRLRMLPVRDDLVSFGEYMGPVGPETERCPVHRIALAVHEETRHVGMPPGAADIEAAGFFEPSRFLEDLAHAFLKLGLDHFPKRLATPSDFLAPFVRRLAELRGGGVRFDPKADCPSLRFQYRNLADLFRM